MLSSTMDQDLRGCYSERFKRIARGSQMTGAPTSGGSRIFKRERLIDRQGTNVRDRARP